MAVYLIEVMEFHPDGNRKRYAIDTYHPTIGTLVSDLRGGPVEVRQIFARVSEDGSEMVIHDSRMLAITQAMVYMISEPNKPYVEYVDVQAPAAETK